MLKQQTCVNIAQKNLYKTYLPPLNADPLAAPNVDEATNMGMTQAITPYKRSANV